MSTQPCHKWMSKKQLANKLKETMAKCKMIEDWMHTHRKRAEKARNEVTRLNFLLQHHDRLRKKLAKSQRRIQGMRNEAKSTQLRVDFLEEELGRAINDCVELGQIINLTNAARRRCVSDLEKATS